MSPHRTVAALAASAALLGLGPSPSLAASTTVKDPVGDTQMQRGGPDIISTTTTFTAKRITVAIEHAGAVSDIGTITGSVLKFRGGGTYTLQRVFPDEGFGTPLKNEILVGQTSKRVKCTGVASKVSKRTVTVSAPVKCFKKRGTAVKSKSFSFTRNVDLDETRRSRWISRG